MCICVGVYVRVSAGAHRVQKGALAPLQLDCVYHHGCWELNFGSLQEQHALRTSAVMETLCFTHHPPLQELNY